MKSKRTVINLIVNILSIPLTALTGLWLTQLTIVNYGSEINGLNSLITQLIAIILVIEGGLGVAINSKLYKPYTTGENLVISAVLSVARRVFQIISLVFSILAFLIALCLPKLIDSQIDEFTIIVLFIFAFVPTSVYLFYTLKYKPLYDISQTEYIFSLTTMITNTLGNLIAILFIYLGSTIEFVRFWIMFFLILRSIILVVISKKRFKNINFNNKEVDYSFLKDMPSVIFIKLTSLIYGTAPIIYISFSAGTVMTSIYSVYNMIFGVLKSLSYGIVNAPSNAFGQLLAENTGENKTVNDKFIAYQLVIVLFIATILTTAMTIILPFISIYTAEVSDANYINFDLAIFLFTITFLEIVHIPSGLIMNIQGNFKENRKIQNIAIIVLLFLIPTLSAIYEVYGIMLAMIVCNIILCFYEIRFVCKRIFYISFSKIVFMIIINLIMCLLIILSLKDKIIFNSYLGFILHGVSLLLVIFVVFYILNWIMFKRYLLILNKIFTTRVLKR